MGKHDDPAQGDGRGGDNGKPGPMKDPTKAPQTGKHGKGNKGNGKK